MLKIRTFFLLGIIGLTLVSCFEKSDEANDPKKRLTDYISKTFSIRQTGDKKDLLDYLSGDARARLEAWSEEQFSQAFIENKRQFIKLIFQEVKKLSPTEVSITYELTFLDQAKGRDAKVTNKKLSQLTLQNGQWLIHDVRNIKELVEYRNEMALP